MTLIWRIEHPTRDTRGTHLARFGPSQGPPEAPLLLLQLLQLLQFCRRFTRLTNDMMFYNFARIHKTLRIRPAMAAGVSDHGWTLQEVAELAP
jgi:hypothetical protein